MGLGALLPRSSQGSGHSCKRPAAGEAISIHLLAVSAEGLVVLCGSRGTHWRPLDTIILIMGTPKKRTPNFGEPYKTLNKINALYSPYIPPRVAYETLRRTLYSPCISPIDCIFVIGF